MRRKNLRRQRDASVSTRMLASSKVTTDQLLQFINSRAARASLDSELIAVLVNNPAVTPEMIHNVIDNSSKHATLQPLFDTPELVTLDTLNRLSNHEKNRIKKLIPSSPLFTEELAEILIEGNIEVVSRVASSPYITQSITQKLVLHPSRYVKVNLLDSPYAPEEFFDDLYKNSPKSLLNFFASAPALPQKYRKPILGSGSMGLKNFTMRDDLSAEECHLLIRKNSWLAAIILERSDVTSHLILLMIECHMTDTKLMSHMSEHPNTPMSIRKFIAELILFNQLTNEVE